MSHYPHVKPEGAALARETKHSLERAKGLNYNGNYHPSRQVQRYVTIHAKMEGSSINAQITMSPLHGRKSFCSNDIHADSGLRDKMKRFRRPAEEVESHTLGQLKDRC